MRYLVLGAGQQGRAIAFDLLRDPESEIVLVDSDPDQLEDILSWLDDPRVDVEPIDAESHDEMRAVMEDMQVAISALPYQYNLGLTQDAIAAGCHLVDLGGNNTVVNAQLELDAEAKAAGITVIPDCGLAPGLAVYLAHDACQRLTRVENLRIRVGGLPQKPQGELEYMLTFSVQGLLNEYSEPCIAIENGEVVQHEPLTGIETINFPDPWGELEAFRSSGGLSTLPRTLQHMVENADYKTIRFPGHGAKMRAFYDAGLFSTEPQTLEDGTEVIPRDELAKLIEKTCNYPEVDAVLVRISAQGLKNNVPVTVRTQIIDRFDKENGITAMMRMTGYPTSIVATMLAKGQISQHGVVPGERCIPMDLLRTELKHRDIHLEEVVRVVD
jgi:lysine 6-dehydrogenase